MNTKCKKMIHQSITINQGRQWRHKDFSPEVHTLASVLVPVVSSNTVVRWLIGITHQAYKRCHKNLPTV